MVDKVSSFVVAIDGEEGTLSSVIAALKKTVRSAVTELEQITKRVELFSTLEQDVKKAGTAFNTATDGVAKLKAQIDKLKSVGSPIDDNMSKALKLLERDATNAGKAFETQQAKLDALGATLRKAGVDTTRLASEQIRLAEATKLAAASASEQAAKQLLGIKTSFDIQPEIRKLNAAYDTLRASGTLTVKELAAAQAALTAKIIETRAQAVELGGGFKQAATDIKASASGAYGAFLGITAILGTVAAGFLSVVSASKQYQQGLAEIGVVTDLTKTQLDNLGIGARVIARTLGVDLNESLKALFEIIRSGVPADNALEVLRVSAEAAKGGLTDIGTTAKISTLLLDGFGLQVSDLGRAFDTLTRGAHDGGATLKQFADNAGPLLNVARDAKVPFNDLIAIFTVMTNASNDAAGSASALTKILVKLGDSDVRGKLHDLGIDTTNVVEIFKQLGAQGKGVQNIIDLGIASGKTAAGVAALTNNAGKLAPELDAVAKSAGAAAEATKKFFDTPQGRADRFNSEMHEVTVSWGELFGSGSRFAQLGTLLAHEFNQIGAAAREAERANNDTSKSFLDVVRALIQINPAAVEAKRALAATAAAAKDAGDEIAAAIKKMALGDISRDAPKLLADIQAMQAASAAAITELNARAAAQIAALDRSTAAEVATAAATITIQTKLASDRLALITKNAAEVLKAIDVEGAARLALEKDNALKTTAVEQSIAQAKLAVLATIKGQYTAHYNDLITQQQAFVTKINSIDATQVAFNRDIQTQLSAIRNEGLSDFDAYIVKTNQIKQLLADAQTEFQKGGEAGLALGKTYTDQAIALTGTVKKVVNADGIEVISAFDAQQTKIGFITKAADQYNAALSAQKDAAETGKKATTLALSEVSALLFDVTQKYDALNKKVEAGLSLKVKVDEKDLSTALATLNDLTKDREVRLLVKTISGANSSADPFNVPTGFARGGLVGRVQRFVAPVREAIQRFANGGSVFKRPSWTKVPGSGDKDTVPAALPTGSFVVKKAASQFYGDGLMQALAKGIRKFAGGGIVDIGGGLFADRSGSPKKKLTPQEVSSILKDHLDHPGDVAPPIDDRIGFQHGDSFQGDLPPPVTFDVRQVPEVLITAANVLAYAREMLNSVGSANPMLGSLLPEILQGIRKVENDPSDIGAIKSLLQSAETIGSNPYLFAMWGKTAGSHGNFNSIWFYDWLKRNHAGEFADAGGRSAPSGGIDISALHRTFAKAVGILNLPPPKSGNPGVAKRFAEGGSTDTVPALLTPGEFVITAPRARELGTDFLHALNNRRVSRDSFSRFSEFAAPPRLRFADGGPVGEIRSDVNTMPIRGSGGQVTNFNMSVNPSELFSVDNIRRHFLPAWNEIQRRGK